MKLWLLHKIKQFALLYLICIVFCAGLLLVYLSDVADRKAS